MRVGPILRELRLSKGIRLDYVARQVGISLSGICQIERGDANPKWDNVVKLSEVLGFSLDWLKEKGMENGRENHASVG